VRRTGSDDCSLTITESYSLGTFQHAHNAPSSMVVTNTTIGTSNLGSVHPLNPLSETLTQFNTPVTGIVFVVAPPDSGSAIIPVTFTLSDGGPNVSFTASANYFADASTDFDDLAWTDTAPSSASKKTFARAQHNVCRQSNCPGNAPIRNRLEHGPTDYVHLDPRRRRQPTERPRTGQLLHADHRACRFGRALSPSQAQPVGSARSDQTRW
jgi:hypothetical protein